MRIPRKVKVPGVEVFKVSTPAVVDVALWERVNELLPRTRKASRASQRRPALLAGLLRCAECGQPTQSYWSKGRGGRVRYFYRCAPHLRNPDRVSCRSHDRRTGLYTNIPAEEIEGAVWGVIDGMLSDVDVLTAAIGASRDAGARMAPAVEERIGHHERRLRKAQLALTRLRRLFLEGDIDEVAYRADKVDYERQVAMLNDELERMRSAQARREQDSASQELVMEIARRWDEIRHGMTEIERPEVLVALLSDITVTRQDDVMVTGTLSALGGSNKWANGGRYWIRTSDLCDVNAAL